MRTSRILLGGALVAAAALPLHAQAPLRAAPSGRATSEVTLSYPRDSAPAGASATPLRIRVDYGQPHLRGRAINTDSLVPFDRPWRTGANNATTLSTDVDLVIGGQTVAKGAYVVYTMPTRSGWTLMLQKTEGTPGMQPAMNYDASKDAARIPLRMQTLSAPLESFSIWLIPANSAAAASGELRMAWGTVQLSTDWRVR